jgi:pimeloyl-ACP methyl ester carboxylesterase
MVMALRPSTPLLSLPLASTATRCVSPRHSSLAAPFPRPAESDKLDTLRPHTEYVRSGSVRLGYQVFGDGDTDLVFVPGFASHVELQWADPLYARFLGRLGSLVRVIVYDKRGVGVSDPVDRAPTLEEDVADLLAVTAAAGSGSAIVLGFSNGSPAAALYAATYPDRCRGLIMCSSFARTRGRADLVAKVAARSRRMIDEWGQGYGLEVFAPSLAGSRLNRTNYALFERAALRPEMARAFAEASRDIDVSGALASVKAPALVLHRRGDFIPFEAGQEVAALLPHAQFVELEGSDHVPFAGDSGALLDAVEDFVRSLTEQPRAATPTATILFTDIVGSTQRASEVGDRRWRELIEAHDELSRAEIGRHDGVAVKSTGDGWLSSFASPPQAVRAAWAISEQMPRLGLEVRAGAHAGPVEHVDGDVRGLTVHGAARVAAAAGAGRVLVSDVVADRCAGAEMKFEPRPPVALKGLPGTWVLHELVGDPGEAQRTEPAEGPVLGTGDRALVALASRVPALPRTISRLARPTGVS